MTAEATAPAAGPARRNQALRHWTFGPADPPPDFEPDKPILLRRVLWSRLPNIGDVAAFLDPGAAPLHSAVLMKGMNEAVELVVGAIQDRRRIAIFGDYDADGVTATALLQRGLGELGAEVITYIPHRVNDGYGLNPEGLEELARQGADLVISCDCGTNSVDVVARRPAGQRLIVTDHHLPAAEIARPDALLNPHQSGCRYPFKQLSGAGVAFKLLQGVSQDPRLSPRADPAALDRLMQLVAVGAIADVVPLIGENRALVWRGLRLLEEQPLPGVQALVETGLLKRPLNSGAVAFQLAPRINAAGRMDDARLALDVLLADTMPAARPLAEQLEQHNQSRRAATETALTEVMERLEAEGLPDSAVVMADARWPLGLVGLIAGRLVDLYHRPAFILNLGDEECRGSARSVDDFNVVDALASCESFLTRYGGHQAAAGFACAVAQLPGLVAGLQGYAAARRPEAGWSQLIPVDAVVGLDELTVSAVEELEVLQPFGQGNRPPRFCCRGVELKAASVFGGESEHLRLWLAQGELVLEAIAWRRGKYLEDYRRAAQRGQPLDALFCPEVNRWDDDATVRLALEDVRKAT